MVLSHNALSFTAEERENQGTEEPDLNKAKAET